MNLKLYFSTYDKLDDNELCKNVINTECHCYYCHGAQL